MPDAQGAPQHPVDAPPHDDPVRASISPERPGPLERRLLRLGRAGWAFVGVAAALAVVGLVASRLTLVIVPVVLALFPATLLLPVANWLKHRRWPPALAALVTLVGAIAIVGLVIGLMVPLFVAQIPELAETAEAGLDEYLTDGTFGLDLGGLAGVIDQAREQFGGFGTIAGPALDAATAAFEVVAGTLLLLVVLFFFLKDGSRIGDGLLVLVPQHHRPRTRAVGRQAFTTLGAFFRGQLLIALVDAMASASALSSYGCRSRSHWPSSSSSAVSSPSWER